MLLNWKELPPGAVISAGARAATPTTGSWRTGSKPLVDAHLCVNCLLCWVHCPEPAVVTENAQLRGFDYDHCKGCGVCAEGCPTGAITMVPEARSVPARGWLE